MKTRRRTRVRWFRLAMFALVGYFLYSCYNQQVQLNTMNREVENNRVRLEQLKESNQQLQEERTRLQNPQYIEKIAREQLGLAKPGEVPYIPAGKN